jgi:hypothetical protein
MQRGHVVLVHLCDQQAKRARQELATVSATCGSTAAGRRKIEGSSVASCSCATVASAAASRTGHVHWRRARMDVNLKFGTYLSAKLTSVCVSLGRCRTVFDARIPCASHSARSQSHMHPAR